MLEDLPNTEPGVIFCRFRSDIESATAAAKATGRTTSELSGSANQLAQWQAGDTSTLVTQIQSGGIGIDLTRASYAVFFSLGYSLAEYEQAVARLHRPGQAKRTLIYHLIATHNGRSTVDGRVYQCLRERKEVVSGIIDGYRTSGATVSAR
jgi:SNF2 family DNA or RNA helicase